MNDHTQFRVIKILGDKIAMAQDENFPHRAVEYGGLGIEGFETDPYMQRYKDGDVILDIGAFVGDTAFGFLKRGCVVHAFEPFFDHCVCAWWNCRQYHHNFHLVNAPVSDGREFELEFTCNGNNFGMRWCREKVGGGVKSVYIDQYNFKRVDFAKIDCEGQECQVLDGMKDTIKRCKPILFVEVYKEALERAGTSEPVLTAKLKSLGYKLTMYGAEPRWDWLCEPA